MKCLVNWIPLNTHVRFEQNLSFLKVGLGSVETHVPIYESIYKAFHRIHFCGYEPIVR